MLDVRSAMRRSAEFHRDMIAVQSQGLQLTFGEAWERGLRLANALLALGLQPGDRVAVLEDNCVEAADFYLGTAAANLVRVPLYRRNSPEAHRHMLASTGCRAAVVASEHAHEIAGITGEIDGLQVIVRGDDYEGWLRSQPPTDPDPAISAGDVFVIRHSAGTTGRAKGIAYTHRCEGQMTGIWNDPEMTGQRLRDGWVRTGDVGRLDEHGFLYEVDRVDDMIISGGFNIWPAEIEQVIARLDGVREVAVFGVPDDRWGESPFALVAAEEGADLDEPAVIEACRASLGSYKTPSRVLFRAGPLPRSPAGKIQRKVLREPYWAGQDRRVAGS